MFRENKNIIFEKQKGEYIFISRGKKCKNENKTKGFSPSSGMFGSNFMYRITKLIGLNRKAFMGCEHVGMSTIYVKFKKALILKG